MKISTILFGTGPEADVALDEDRLWARAGLEPSTTELLADPIALLLMRADKLQAGEVQSLLREASERRARAAERQTRPGRALFPTPAAERRPIAAQA